MDGFGNLNNVSVTKGSAPTLSVTYDASTNRRTTDCSDANGNISPCGGGITFDAVNRISVGNGTDYYYDSGNQRVWKGTGTYMAATGEYAFYAISGAKLATYTTTISTSNIRPSSPVYYEYFAGKMLKNSTGWVNSDGRSSIGKFFPYGQERPSATTNNKEKFATYYRDTETSLDYAQNRYEAPGDGRFLSPDPYKTSAGVEDPGSWNRYAYVQGDPVNRTDPSGLDGIDWSTGSADCSWAAFACVYFQNMSAQDPYGCSVWGCTGAAQSVFAYDLGQVGPGQSGFLTFNSAYDVGGSAWDDSGSGGGGDFGGGGGESITDGDICNISFVDCFAGGKFKGKPCGDLLQLALDVITGAGMPGGKGIYDRIVEQIIGQDGLTYSTHETEIEGYRNRLRNILDEWNRQNCGPPPGGLGDALTASDPTVVRNLHNAWHAFVGLKWINPNLIL